VTLSPEEKERRKQKRRQKKWNEQHKIIDDVDHKFCNDCKEYYPATREHFYNKKTYDGLDTYCITCTVKRTKKNFNLERNKELHRKYRKSHDCKSRVSNRESARKRRERGYYNNYNHENKDKIKQYNKNRRRKEHIISKKEWIACKSYFNNSCAYCGMTYKEHKELRRQDLHKEHVDPNGSVYLDNCIPSCWRCNSGKLERTLQEWYTEDNPSFLQERLDLIHNWLQNDYTKYFEGLRERKKYKKKTD
jgi:hypothetical protein